MLGLRGKFILHCLSIVILTQCITCPKVYDVDTDGSESDTDSSSDDDVPVGLNFVDLISIVCPRKSDIHKPIGRTNIVLFSPVTLQDVVIKIDRNNLDSSVKQLIDGGFDLRNPSVMYVPGWRETATASWLRRIRRRYASKFKGDRKRPAINLLFFEFPEDTGRSYRKIAARVPALGKVLAEFFTAFSHRVAYRMTRMHMIGFSISTHIVGVAGRLLGRNGNPVRQVTALDPAGPCFFGKSDFAREYTLNPDAANLVVARHYGFGNLGARRSVGGLDIFVNGGREQPDSIRHSEKYFIMRKNRANHRTSAFHEALASVNASCHEVAYRCDSYDLFLQGACGNCISETDCFHMHSLSRVTNQAHPLEYRRNTKMYILAGGNNYCLHHYQMIVLLKWNAPPEVVSAFKSGRIRVRIGSGEVTPQRAITCRGTQAFTSLITSERRLHVIDLRDITIYEKRKPSENLSTSALKRIKLNYMSHPLEAERRSKSITLCPKGEDRMSTSTCSIREIKLHLNC